MELSYNGGYGYTGDHARAINAMAHAENLAHWARLLAREQMTPEQREAQVLGAYPKLRGDPHHDSSARR